MYRHGKYRFNGGIDVLEFMLSGSSKDRRKQEREIYRKYPDHKIEKRGQIFYKNLTTGRVPVEEANKVRTQILVYLKKA